MSALHRLPCLQVLGFRIFICFHIRTQYRKLTQIKICNDIFFSFHRTLYDHILICSYVNILIFFLHGTAGAYAYSTDLWRLTVSVLMTWPSWNDTNVGMTRMFEWHEYWNGTNVGMTRMLEWHGCWNGTKRRKKKMFIQIKNIWYYNGAGLTRMLEWHECWNALIAHLYTFAPPRCRTSQYRRSFIPLSVSLWNDLVDPIFDGVGLAGFKSRSNAFLLAELLSFFVFNYFPFLFFSSICW